VKAILTWELSRKKISEREREREREREEARLIVQ
jgi:hypothetical protein